VDIEFSRICNEYNIKSLASYLGAEDEELQSYYREIINDEQFLTKINQQFELAREAGFNKGIIGKGVVGNIDWFAFERILIYVLVRYKKPKKILETGVYYGGNSVFALQALERNGVGLLTSIDLPDENYKRQPVSKGSLFQMQRHPEIFDTEFYDTKKLSPGFVIPQYLLKHWSLILGSSLDEIPKMQDVTFDFYIHDSEHSYEFLTEEIRLVYDICDASALFLIDDIDWSNAFFNFVSMNELYPLLLTDNGKDNLRVRTGLVDLAHKNNKTSHYTR
jgi:hypothetical protein